MASLGSHAALRQQPASCSGRGLWPAATRCLPPPPGRRRPAPPRAALADEQQQEQEAGQRRIVKKMEFVYQSPEEAAAAEAKSQAAWEAGMKEYEDLQEWLLFRTWRFGLLFSGYLLFVASSEAAFCELIGAAVGYGYFKWLISDVSRLQPGDRIPLREAEKVEPQLARWVAKLGAAYRQALQPRLLVLVGLFAGLAAYNALAAPEDQLTLVEQGCLIGGFFSYKIALILKIYEDNKPRTLTQDEILRQQRPSLADVEDVKIDLRQIAKKQLEQRQEQQPGGGSSSSNGSAAAAAEQQPAQQQQQERSPPPQA